MSQCNLEMKNHFGRVKLDDEMRHAYNLIANAAWALQVTPGEMMEILSDAPQTCPHCEAEKRKH